MTKSLPVNAATAAILADRGPAGREARNDLAHKLPAGLSFEVMHGDTLIAVIDTATKQAWLVYRPVATIEAYIPGVTPWNVPKAA